MEKRQKKLEEDNRRAELFLRKNREQERQFYRDDTRQPQYEQRGGYQGNNYQENYRGRGGRGRGRGRGNSQQY